MLSRSASRKAISGRRRSVAITLAAFFTLVSTLLLVGPLGGTVSAVTIPMVFPLEIRVPVRHDYLAPRDGHLHQGTDLMAPKMTKIIAVVSGRVTLRVSSYNGLPSYSLWLAGDDGHGYFYIHINNDTPGTDDGQGGLQYAFAPGLVSGAQVDQGQFIAYVGDSGNAESTSPHLHFEIHETTSMSSPSLDPYDSVYNAPLFGTPPPDPSVVRYEQTSAKIGYKGTWLTFTASGASGGSYKYADSAAGATVWFSGSRLDWIATKGYTQGKATVSLDGGAPVTVDLSSPSTLRQQKVWSTGDIAEGTHRITISWTGQKGGSGSGTRVNIDALDVKGNLVDPPATAALTRYEQTNAKIAYKGTWLTFTASGASGGSYKYADSAASATVRFTGTRLDWIATKGYTQGKAAVSLDGGSPVVVDLYSPTTLRQVKVWSTGLVALGPHTLTITWLGQRSVAAGGTRVNLDALDVVGALD
jgi:murein DD-endopeptidase MepM/ murein hydrolase activator NlpD